MEVVVRNDLIGEDLRTKLHMLGLQYLSHAHLLLSLLNGLEVLPRAIDLECHKILADGHLVLVVLVAAEAVGCDAFAKTLVLFA